MQQIAPNAKKALNANTKKRGSRREVNFFPPSSTYHLSHFFAPVCMWQGDAADDDNKRILSTIIRGSFLSATQIEAVLWDIGVGRVSIIAQDLYVQWAIRKAARGASLDKIHIVNTDIKAEKGFHWVVGHLKVDGRGCTSVKVYDTYGKLQAKTRALVSSLAKALGHESVSGEGVGSQSESDGWSCGVHCAHISKQLMQGEHAVGWRNNRRRALTPPWHCYLYN